MYLKANSVSMEINGRKLFDNISLEVNRGESLAIVGPSGSGKTTLLNCLALLQRPSSGSITIDEKNYDAHKRKDVLSFWKKEAAIIYQDSGVIDDETISYNVSLRRAIGKKKTNTAIEEALKIVGLGGRGAEIAAVLSGGEKRRLGVARAIYKDASVIFADEPTASLDARNRALVANLLLQQAAGGRTVIIATHDMELAESCDLVLNL